MFKHDSLIIKEKVMTNLNHTIVINNNYCVYSIQ